MEKKISRRSVLNSVLAGSAYMMLGPAFFSGCGGDYDVSRRRKVLDAITKADSTADLPNIIIILTDDLGYGDLECYGSEAIKTPNINKMADEGMLMTQFYASAPVCSPSRAGLLTGRYPIRTEINGALINDKKPVGLGSRLMGYTRYPGIPEDEVLLPEMLKRRGYNTALVGKWHLGNRKPCMPNDRGFDYFYGPRWSNDIKPFEIFENRKIVDAAPVKQETLTGRYTEKAIDFIKANRDTPFFIQLSHTFPHIPLYASEKFRGKSDGGLYGDTIEELDWSTGKVLDTLKELGIDGNTLVIFTSDNGPWWQGSPGNTRGRKRFVFEGGFRVPMIARWPGVIPAGRKSDVMSMNFDLFSTVLSLAGVDLPSDRIIDGKNIMPVLKGSKESPHDTLYFYWRENLWAVRHKKWKYHRHHQVEDINTYPWPTITEKGPYMYNLQTDPHESYSMIETHPRVAKKLSNMMQEMDRAVEKNTRGWL